MDEKDLSGNQFGHVEYETEDDTVATGVVYRCDYAGQQEYGIGEVREALCGTDPRQVEMLASKSDHVAVFADVNAIAISSRPLSDSTPNWGDPINGAPDDYADEYTRRLSWAQGVTLPWFATVATLRELAKERGVSPIPRKKADLEAAIIAASTPSHPDRWPGNFSYGKTLILRADTGQTADTIAKLADAIETGHLTFGTTSGPFHRGLFIGDGRDLGPKSTAAHNEACDWYDEKMADLALVREALEADGHRFYFLGNPTELSPGGRPHGLYYWMNGNTVRTAHGAQQPCGWYTLDELASLAWLTDAEDKAAERAGRQATVTA
jgi:hypothetical protein